MSRLKSATVGQRAIRSRKLFKGGSRCAFCRTLQYVQRCCQCLSHCTPQYVHAMSKIEERLKAARTEAGYATATDAAKAFGWNENSYRSNENGSRGVSRSNALKYSKAFRVSVEWLLTGRGSKRLTASGLQLGIALRQIPIVRWSDITTAEKQRIRLLGADARGHVTVPEGENLSSDAFALEIEDDSMVDPEGSPSSLYQGDTIIIDPDRKVAPGAVVLALDNGSAVVRKLRMTARHKYALIPLNPDHPSSEVAADNTKFVVGVMAGFYRRIR